MNDDFKTLMDFLGGFGPEASGRMSAAPDSATAEKLERFALGEVGTVEREEVCAMLQLHPAWLRYLAERVKQSRSVGVGEDGEET